MVTKADKPEGLAALNIELLQPESGVRRLSG
jgi:hypothetical protein